MAFNLEAECARINDCSGAISEQKFRNLAARLLCEIATNTGNPPAPTPDPGNGNGEPDPVIPTPVTWLPLNQIDTSVTNLTLYQPLLTDAGANNKLYISIYNTSNEPLLVSFNGGLNDHLLVTANGSVTLRLGAQGRGETGGIHVKALDVVPNSGIVYASSYYGGASGIVTDATWVTMGTVETDLAVVGSVDITGYQTLLNDIHNKLYLNIYNGSNEAILISFNGGGANHLVVSAFGSVTLELGEAGGAEDSAVHVKALSTLPSSGIIYASAYY